jgi:hypothetical protein
MELAKPKPGAIGWVAAVRGGNRGVNGQSAGSRGGKFVAQRCRRRKRCRLSEAQAAVAPSSFVPHGSVHFLDLKLTANRRNIQTMPPRGCCPQHRRPSCPIRGTTS